MSAPAFSQTPPGLVPMQAIPARPMLVPGPLPVSHSLRRRPAIIIPVPA